MHKDELHAELDRLVPDDTRGRINTRIIGHFLIELGRMTSMTCSWEHCTEVTREFVPLSGTGRGKRHPLSMSVDHVVSRSDGGSDMPSNIQMLHFMCNSKKGAIDARKNPVVRQKLSEAMSKRWEDPAYRDMMASLPRTSPARSARRSQVMKDAWADPETRARRLDAVRRGHETRKTKNKSKDS